MRSLFDTNRLGALTLRNRIVMAPMTRNRAHENGDPNELMVEYYTQRASMGLIITEGTAPEHVGKAYPGIPGIYTDSQSLGWRKITDSVHAHGGRIFLQLMHSGRISHKKITGLNPISASAVKPAGEIFTGAGQDSFETPHQMSHFDLEKTRLAFVSAAQRAVNAGFDGVEIHGANGYLLHQFLSTNSNLRTDEYGRSPENRSRYIIEIIDSLLQTIGSNRVGIRLSPNGKFNDINESDVAETYGYLMNVLSSRELAYLHVAQQSGFEGIAFARNNFRGTLIANTGYGDTNKIETAKRIIEEGQADLFSFGRLALANPDLPKRLAEEAKFNPADSKSFYSRGATGYTDYSALS